MSRIAIASPKRWSAGTSCVTPLASTSVVCIEPLMRAMTAATSSVRTIGFAN